MPSTESVWIYEKMMKKLLELPDEEIYKNLLDRDGEYWSYNSRECARHGFPEISDIICIKYTKEKKVDLLIAMLVYTTSPGTMRFFRHVSRWMIKTEEITTDMIKEFLDKVKSIPGKYYLREFSSLSGQCPLGVYEKYANEEKMKVFTSAGYELRLLKFDPDYKI